MAEEMIELIDTKIDLHEADHPHHDAAECAARIAILEAEIEELKRGAHEHVDEEFEEVPEE
jgi:hypothetical protein